MSSKLDELYLVVTDAILRAETLSDVGAPGAVAAYFDVSMLEEAIAEIAPASTGEGAIARRGAVRAALSAGDQERASQLVERFAAEPEAPDELISELRIMLDSMQQSAARVHEQSVEIDGEVVVERQPDHRASAESASLTLGQQGVTSIRFDHDEVVIHAKSAFAQRRRRLSAMRGAIEQATPTAVTLGVVERRESNARSYARGFDALFTNAQGSLVYDIEGREYIDFLAGAGSLNYGHNDPDMKAALIDYLAQDGITHNVDLFTDAKVEFLETLERLVLEPRGLPYRVQFTGPTGANAVEAALKLARKVTGRTNVIAFTNGFHGVSHGALAATADRHHRMAPTVPLPGVTRVAFDGYHGPDIDTSALLAKLLADPSGGIDAPAAILLETVQGEGGLNVASPYWLNRIASLARMHDAVLIVDDVQAGCGRTGTFFSFEGTGIEPDMVVLSKSISGFGLPMALLLMRPELDVWEPGEHNGTFRGNGHAFVTARVALEKFWDGDAFEREIALKSAIVREGLNRVPDLLPGARVKGRGLMQGIDVGSGDLAAEITTRCFDDGLIIETSGPQNEVVKVFAPLTTPNPVLERGLDILRDAVDASTLPALQKGS
jgi:diaminobutyrate-2-oxoglutarate transaminase